MKVSIIVPVYNVENYLRECLDSVVNQTLDDIEIICINDGSTDNSLSILNEYKENYKNLMVIDKKNQGPGPTRNKGIEIATGDYIYFLDSDDYIDLNTIDICYNESKKYNLDMITFDAECIYNNLSNEDYSEDGHYDRKGLEYLGVIDGKDFYIKSKKMRNNAVSACLTLYNRNFVLNNNLFFEDTLHEDTIYILKCFLSANKVKYINKKLYKRRIRPNSIMTSKISKGRIVGYINIVNDLLNNYSYILNSYDSELKDIFMKDIYGLLQVSLFYCSNIHNLNKDFLDIINICSNFSNIEFDILMNTPILSFSKDKLYLDKEYEFKIRNKSKIYLILTPVDGNLYNQAVFYATIKFLKDKYKNYDIIKIPYTRIEKNLSNIINHFKEGDFIILQGGTSEYDLSCYEEMFRLYSINSLKDLPLISFPQTIYLNDINTNKEVIEQVKYTYNNSNNLVLLASGESSYNTLKKLFVNNKVFICPDIVFYLYNKIQNKYNLSKTNQIMTFLSDDLEKERLVCNLSSKYNVFKYYMSINRYINTINLEDELYDLWNEYFKSRVVITDTHYSMIFSVITKTPCIVIDGFDDNLYDNYKWVENLNYIKYTNDISFDNISKLIYELLNIDEFDELSFDGYFEDTKYFIDNSI